MVLRCSWSAGEVWSWLAYSLASQKSPSLQAGGLKRPLAQSQGPEFTPDRWGTGGGNRQVGAIYQVFERYGGNISYEDNRIGRLLPEVIDALQNEKKQLRVTGS